jgi:hypothetical protein
VSAADSPMGFELSIPMALADELRREVRSGRMTLNQFDHRIAETGKTAPLPLIRFLFEDYRDNDDF